MKTTLAAILVALILTFSSMASAQLAPIPMQGSPAAGEGSHLFTGSVLYTVAITWNAGTGARYLMIFDGALPANGGTTSCTTTLANKCLLWCGYAPNSTTAPNLQTFDFTSHPIPSQNGLGVTAALSTGAGCGTLTVDTGTDWYYGQVK